MLLAPSKLRFVTLILLLLFCSSQRAFAADVIERLQAESLAHTSADITLSDATRKKSLEVRVTYPLKAGRYPVIIFSHGATGSKKGYGYLADYWAEHGYVVLRPSHYDSADAVPRSRHSALSLLRKLPSDVSGWKDRAADISFVVSKLPEVKPLLPKFTGTIDARALGVAGHSYGAFTTLLIAGARVPGSVAANGKNQRLFDPRVKAMVALSAQGIKTDPRAFGFDDEKTFSELCIPALYMTGDQDESFWTKLEQRMHGYKFSKPGDKYAVTLSRVNHGTFAADGAAPQQLRDIQYATTLFWDAYLKQDTASATFLKANGLQKLVDGRGRAELR